MSTYRLEKLLAPRSVALVGASPREGSLGHAVLRNLKSGRFNGKLSLINPRYKDIQGHPVLATLDDLTSTPDLLIIATPAPTVPGLIAKAAAKGIPAAIILTAGLGHGPGSLAEQVEKAARECGLRLVGPNCLGVIAPLANLNASFASAMPPRGGLAVISQSGAIAAAMAEWGIRHSAGFSAIVSVGDQLDVDFGDLLDYFALDPATRSILLYVESIKDARKFMSAARAVARTKPVVVIKSGRLAQGAKAAATHTGALAGSDAVYDAAFRRAGLLRVFDLSELFDAAETLSHFRKLNGNRLAVLTNGGGAGVLAIDRLAELGGVAAELSPETFACLDKVLPPTWSKGNPVDIIGDADAKRYVDALEALLADPANNAVLVLNVQTALTSSLDLAKAVGGVVRTERSRRIEPKPVLASWIGGGLEVEDALQDAAVPTYRTEAEAVRGFMHLVRYNDAQRQLMETPPSLPEDFKPDAETAQRIVARALSDGRKWLDPLEVNKVLTAYSIPALPVFFAPDPEAAAKAAAPLLTEGGHVVVKILSRDIVHKSDVGGVRLNIGTAQDVRKAAEDIIANAKKLKPEADIDGVTVQPMVIRPKARELIAGMADDPTFGPVIVFGRGGTAVEIIDDKALALPPLDLKLAHNLIQRTRVSRILDRYRDVPAAKRDDVALTLVKLAQLASDIPEIRELDINPLLADETGVVALDARIAIAPAISKSERSRLALRPYPKEWERLIKLTCGRSFLVRPVRPEDEPLYTPFFAHVSNEDLRLRFFAAVKDFNHAFIARLTQIDYARAMAFIVIDPSSKEMLGVVRLHADANYETAEYAILLRSDVKGLGLGWKLMQLIIEYARNEKLKRIHGQVLHENTTMLRMCRELGFDVKPDPDDCDVCLATYDLEKRPALAAS